MNYAIDSMQPEDWPQVRAIYQEGIATGQATFETTAPDWEQWNAGHLPLCRLVASDREKILGWAALIAVSRRQVYSGVAEVSVIDMASSYSVLASGGYKTPAYGITRITTLQGKVIFQADTEAPRERVLQPQTVIYMDQLMRAVVTSGTGRNANVPGVPAVGKTGTTSSYRDAWFCGFTGNYVAVVWFGNDDYSATATMTGGILPAITWQKFMAYAHSNIEIKPVIGVDFKPAPFVVASTTEGAPATLQAPPVLQPQAAQKLLDLADAFHASLLATKPVADQASLAVPGEKI